MGIDCLGPILDVELAYYSIEREFKVESRVLQAFQEGADVIIGGVITVEASRKHHRPCVLIRSGAEGIIQAALEAKRIAEARRIEKVKSTLFQTVLDYAYEGIISIDQNNRVAIFNPVAEKITKVDGKRAIGRNVQATLPQLELGRLLQTGRDELGQIISANKKGKPGLLEIAHGGTLFLDEIAEMDYSLQSKLLRERLTMICEEPTILDIGDISNRWRFMVFIC